MERGEWWCRKGARVRVGAVLYHVVVAAAAGLGLFFRVGGTAPRAEPGSASAAAWRLLAAPGAPAVPSARLGEPPGPAAAPGGCWRKRVAKC